MEIWRYGNMELPDACDGANDMIDILIVSRCCLRQFVICIREVEKCNFCKQSRIHSFINFFSWTKKHC